MPRKVAVLIPAAGSSSRFKGNKKKQFAEIAGRAVFLRSIEAFADRDDVCQIIMAISADDEELFNIKYGANLGFYGVKAILGGEHRYETIEKMLAQVKEEVNLIALHDAVRPCVTQKQIDAVFDAGEKSGAAILAAPLVGTVKKVGADMTVVETIDRSELWEAQTPQVFKPEIIRKAYEKRDKLSEAITDDAQLVEAIGQAVQIVKSDHSNIKITVSTDIAIAGAIIKSCVKAKPSGPTGPWAAEQMW